MKSLANEAQIEITVERSRFIALSFRIGSPEEGKQKLKEAQDRFPGATHYSYAWRLSESEEFASDGGEPRGSAGRPILGMLRHFGLTQAMVVVVRYFGGKKLGIRGLIEAYGEAARRVLEKGGIKGYTAECLLVVQFAAPYRDAVINRIMALVKEKGRLSLEGDHTLRVRIAEKDRERLWEVLSREQKEGKILQFREE